MIISLFRKDKIITTILPEKVNGQYWIEDVDEKGNVFKIISVEAVNGKWQLKGNRLVKISDGDSSFINSCFLNEQQFYKIIFLKDYSSEFLYAENDTDDRKILTKYVISSKADLTIGRDQKNSICYKNTYISSCHAVLSFDGVNSWSLKDLDSTNGTFLNGKRINGTVDLNYGDYIYILGLKIFIGEKFFAINNPDGQVNVNSNLIVLLKEQSVSRTDDIDFEVNNKYYFRSPKFQRELEPFKLKIDQPPHKEQNGEMPVAFVIGPSMTMGIASIFTALSSIVNYTSQDPSERNFISILPTLAMAIGMLAGTMVWPLITKNIEKKNKIKREELRKKKYIAYLNDCRQKIQEACIEQKNILLEHYPSVEIMSSSSEFWEHGLWSRILNREDFLDVRVGVGNIDFDSDIDFPQKSFSIDEDDLSLEVNKMSIEDYSLMNVPIVHSLFRTKVTGIASNNRELTFGFLRNVILQLSMLQSYDELKIAVICNRVESDKLRFVKWLPHLWNNEKTIRYMATSFDEVKELSSILVKEIQNRKEANNEEINKNEPHYIIIATSKELTLKSDLFTKIVESGNIGFSAVFAFGEMKDLPKECTTVIELDSNESAIYDQSEFSDYRQAFRCETVSNDLALAISKELSNINLDLTSSYYELPSMLTFLDMFEVGKIEHLNALERWKNNNSVVSLQTPVGVDVNGEPFMVDFHEKYHGPHGLIAGMTGSGKSEFIITFILSLAINYSPNEVSFILIDYKGGGLTGAFENDDFKLPHLAGTITNLDGSAIQRALLSIDSELRRRQKLFNKARKVSNEGTMDIYKYQKLYRNGIVNEPIPHLFIISDEFAELKAQKSEFMDQLISTARIGRSLGVHLILATQKPSGVVDDQIWSNARAKICLKVQDKNDSVDMIKRPDAAEISQTGRFYLQVGFNELFELGQSAWSGAPYIPKDTNVEKSEERKVSLLDNLGREERSVSIKQETKDAHSDLTQVVEINKYIYQLAKEEKLQARPLWLDPIPFDLKYDNLKKKYCFSRGSTFELNYLLGEVDDPANQKQFALSFSFGADGNLLLFGSTGSGKTMLLNTMLYSLLLDYNAQELNVYILDFGAETFGSFNNAPQVADVVFSGDNEKIKNLFKLLSNELLTRKKLFAAFGGSFKEFLNHNSTLVPNIVVIINNFTSFYESNDEYDEILMQLLREGSKYGIYFVVTANSFNDIRYRIIQSFNHHLVLQENDSNEYAMILGPTGGVAPSKNIGRGLVAFEKHVYEFQTASAFNVDNMISEINDFSQELQSMSKYFAEKIPVLPDKVNLDYIKGFENDISKFIVGINCNTLKPATINLSKHSIYSIVSQDKEDCIDFCSSIANYASEFDDSEVVLIDCSKIFENIDNAKIISDDFENEFKKLYNCVLERNNAIKTNNWNAPDGLDMHRVFCIVYGLSDLISHLSHDFNEDIKIMFEKIDPAFNVYMFIFESKVDLANYSFENWYKQQINSNGIWVGDGVLDQFVFNISKKSRDLSKEIDNEFGFIINRGRATFVKLLDNSEE